MNDGYKQDFPVAEVTCLTLDPKKEGYWSVVDKLRDFYDINSTDKGLRFEANFESELSRKNEKTIWKNKVFDGEGGLYALVNVQLQEPEMDVDKLKQIYRVFLNVIVDGSKDMQESLKERDGFESFLENKRF